MLASFFSLSSISQITLACCSRPSLSRASLTGIVTRMSWLDLVWPGLLIGVLLAEGLPRDSWRIFLSMKDFILCWFLLTVDGDFDLRVVFGAPGLPLGILIWRVPNCSPFLVSRNKRAWSPLLLSSWNVSSIRLMASPFIFIWPVNGPRSTSAGKVAAWRRTCSPGKGHTSTAKGHTSTAKRSH